MQIIRRTALILALVYVLYVICFAFLPYLRQRNVDEDFRRTVDTDDFYGDSPCGDRVALVEAPKTSLDARIRLLAEAKETLDIAYYAVNTGEATDLFLAAILDAADRGVHVRLLLDGAAGDLKRSPAQAAALGSHDNIELRFYNPARLLKPWTVNGRMHDKYIIADNRFLLLGGRNIGDRFFGPPSFRKDLSIDRDVLVYNTRWSEDSRDSVLFRVREYMDGIWSGEHTEIGFAEPRKDSRQEADRMRTVFDRFRRERPELFSRQISWEEATCPANRVTLVSNGTEIGPKPPRVGYVLKKLLLEAEESVLLQSPYVVLSSRMEAGLKELGEKNVDYRILTNSMGSTPNFPAFALYLKDRQKVLDTGARIFEFQNSDAIHAKTYIIDGRMSLVGSFNLDPRSEAIDTELLLAIDSAEFAGHLGGVVGQYLDNSLEVGADGEYIEKDGLAVTEESCVKRGALKALGFLLSPFRSLV